MVGIITKDGSITFYNEEVDETYHSITGAREEAIEKFAKPALSFLRKRKFGSKIDILDFCFGLGYNTAAFIDEIMKINFNLLNVIGIEKDENIINEIGKIDYPFASGIIINEVAMNKYYHSKKINIDLHIVDALDFQYEKDKFDVVFFDPFSPRKVPEMWSEEVFRKLHGAMKYSSILITYSCAGMARRNMKRAGFIVKDGPVVGRKAPGTIALKENYLY